MDIPAYSERLRELVEVYQVSRFVITQMLHRCIVCWSWKSSKECFNSFKMNPKKKKKDESSFLSYREKASLYMWGNCGSELSISDSGDSESPFLLPLLATCFV